MESVIGAVYKEICIMRKEGYNFACTLEEAGQMYARPCVRGGRKIQAHAHIHMSNIYTHIVTHIHMRNTSVYVHNLPDGKELVYRPKGEIRPNAHYNSLIVALEKRIKSKIRSP